MCYYDISKITEKIYLGNIHAIFDENALHNFGITHVLTCCSNIRDTSDSFDQLSLEIEDICSENIYQYFQLALNFIDQSDIIYIHCMAGVSRSASFVIAYLMWKERLSYIEAQTKVKERRPCICPNEGFVLQLKQFEHELMKNNYDLSLINFS